MLTGSRCHGPARPPDGWPSRPAHRHRRWASNQHEIDFVDAQERLYEVKVGRAGPLDFIWFPKTLPKRNLLVVGGGEFASSAVKGITVEQFLLADDAASREVRHHPKPQAAVDHFVDGRDIEVADFNTLKAKLKASDGNLSVQLRKLEDAGCVLIVKSFAGRKPLTRISMTDKGRAAFVAYLDAIEKLLPRHGDKG